MSHPIVVAGTIFSLLGTTYAVYQTTKISKNQDLHHQNLEKISDDIIFNIGENFNKNTNKIVNELLKK